MKTIKMLNDNWGEVTFHIRDSFSKSVEPRIKRFLRKTLTPTEKIVEYSILWSTTSPTDIENICKCQFLVTYR